MLKSNSSAKAFAKAIAAVAFALLLAFSPLATVYASEYSEGFYIEDYDVDMVVGEDGAYNITETIDVYFTEYKHGIYRSIPTSMTIARADGSTGRGHASVKNFSCNANWEVASDYDASGNGIQSAYTVRLGDADQLVRGHQTYKMSYRYVVDGDLLVDQDEFYYNIIGTGWATHIDHASFTIEMPKEFEKENVGLSLGKWGTEGHRSGELAFEVDGNVIYGETVRTLSDHEGLSIRIELPESYFTNQPAGTGLLPIYLVPILFTLISVLLWFKNGRDVKPVETVEFRPPQGCNSLDAGLFDHFNITNEDVLSLLIHLADKGYIEIQPDFEGGRRRASDDFTFIKLRSYDGDNQCEREFMNGLFLGRNYATKASLEERFYKTISRVKAIENTLLLDKVVSRKSRGPIMTMMILAYVIVTLPVLFYEDIMVYAMSLFGLVGIFLIPRLSEMTGLRRGQRIGRVLLCLFIAIFTIGVPVLMFVVPVLQRMTPFIGMAFAVDLIFIGVMMVLWNIAQQRTRFGVDMAGKIGGFKNFLETAEKDRIQRMVEEDPQSFYHILPYAYSLGVTDKWIKKFEGITVPKPDWYASNTAYWDGYTMGRLINYNMMNSFSNVATSRPAPEASSGGGGGGGFSGGGFGGGGGGSW